MTEPDPAPASALAAAISTDELVVALRPDHGGPTARLERRLAAPVDDVWSVLTTPDRIGRWLAPLRTTGPAGVGTVYTLDFGEGGDVTGVVEECRPPHHLTVTWEWPGEAPSTVAVDLRPEASGTVLVLEHRRLPVGMAVGYAAGWHAYAERLAAEAVDDVAPDWDARFAALLPAYRASFPDATVVPGGHVVGHAERPVVVLERVLRATPSEVWAAWTDPERLARWLGAVDAALTPGATVHIAMAAGELPADPAGVANPATFEVREAAPPTTDRPGRLVFTFDDPSDPGGVVTVTMAEAGDDRCRLVLRHALAPAPGALDQTPGFGAGWDGFLDWLEDVLARREHGPDDRYEPLVPYYARQRDRLARTDAGELEPAGSTAIVRHRRTIAASPAAIWSLLTTRRGLAQWLGEVVSGELAEGGTVVVDHDPSTPGQRQTSRITTWVPERALAMTWSFPGEPDSALELTLRPVAGGTELVLVHRDLGAPAASYRTGWHAHLDRLVALAEGDAPPPWAQAFAAVGGDEVS